jgi:hypothetical protein
MGKRDQYEGVTSMYCSKCRKCVSAQKFFTPSMVARKARSCLRHTRKGMTHAAAASLVRLKGVANAKSIQMEPKSTGACIPTSTSTSTSTSTDTTTIVAAPMDVGVLAIAPPSALLERPPQSTKSLHPAYVVTSSQPMKVIKLRPYFEASGRLIKAKPSRVALDLSHEEVRLLLEYRDGADHISFTGMYTRNLVVMAKDWWMELLESKGETNVVHDGVTPPRAVSDLVARFAVAPTTYTNYTGRSKNIGVRVPAHRANTMMLASFGPQQCARDQAHHAQSSDAKVSLHATDRTSLPGRAPSSAVVESDGEARGVMTATALLASMSQKPPKACMKSHSKSKLVKSTSGSKSNAMKKRKSVTWTCDVTEHRKAFKKRHASEGPKDISGRSHKRKVFGMAVPPAGGARDSVDSTGETETDSDGGEGYMERANHVPGRYTSHGDHFSKRRIRNRMNRFSAIVDLGYDDGRCGMFTDTAAALL